MAVFCDRSGALVSDHEDASGGFYDVVGDGLELVDLEHSGDLREEAFEESEVAPGDAFDRGDSLSVGEVVRVEGAAEASPSRERSGPESLRTRRLPRMSPTPGNAPGPRG